MLLAWWDSCRTNGALIAVATGTPLSDVLEDLTGYNTDTRMEDRDSPVDIEGAWYGHEQVTISLCRKHYTELCKHL